MPNKDKLKNSYWEEEGCNIIDLRFAKFLKTIGKHGEKAAKEIFKQSKENHKLLKQNDFEYEFRVRTWSLWINKNKSAKNSIVSPYLKILTEVIWLDFVKQTLEENSQSQSLQKIPVNIFNLMLTTKDATLEKLHKRIIEISNKIPEMTDEKRLTQLKNNLKLLMKSIKSIYKLSGRLSL